MTVSILVDALPNSPLQFETFWTILHSYGTLPAISLSRIYSFMKDDSIFSLRFGSNVKLEPSGDELKFFLESRKAESKEQQGDDLSPYWELLTAVANYKTGLSQRHFRVKCCTLYLTTLILPNRRSARC